jgi:Spy/CpxP family protein refolding chaperone
MNHKVLSAAVLIALGIAVSPSLFAQQTAPPDSSQGTPAQSVPETKGSWPTPEEAVAKMSNKLNLTDGQKAQITPIIADRQAEMQTLMQDTSTRRMQKARKAKSIMADSDKKIEALLTKDQKKTYDEMKEEMREQFRSHMQERNSGGLQ